MLAYATAFILGMYAGLVLSSAARAAGARHARKLFTEDKED